MPTVKQWWTLSLTHENGTETTAGVLLSLSEVQNWIHGFLPQKECVRWSLNIMES